MQDDESEAIRKLMRLKRYETPGEVFTEEFLREFHRRQREAAQRQAGFERFLQMLGDKFEAFLNPKWGFAAAAAVIALVAVFLNGFDSAAPIPPQAAPSVVKVEDAKKKADSKNELKNKPSGVAIPVNQETNR